LGIKNPDELEDPLNFATDYGRMTGNPEVIGSVRRISTEKR
jgi:hypothetical protein